MSGQYGSKPKSNGRSDRNMRTSEPSMTVIDAPYNFVPLSDQVVTPEWAARVSHDVPFQDGISGEIRYTLTAHSPLLVGGRQTKNPDGTITVNFFETPEGYAIPGTSIKGMIRAVLEIATFSRMSMVDDKRYGMRDISGKYVAQSYMSRVQDRVNPGFLHLNEAGHPEIVPCEMARVSHRDLEVWWNVDKPIFKARETVAKKYESWNQHCRKRNISAVDFPVTLAGDNVVTLGKGDIAGFPVLTGQISDCTHDKGRTRGKYRDFVFHSAREEDAFSVHETDAAAWRDFLFIHGDEDGKSDAPWTGHWKKQYWLKRRVPVFFIKHAGKLQIGLAYMPKLAGDFSIHDMIGHTGKAHLDPTRSDFATLLFGRIGLTADDALKGRAYFETTMVQNKAKPLTPPPAILSSPKPTYFPNYIRQMADASTSKLIGGNNAQYATYLETQTHPKPELRGWKRYPARPDDEVAVQTPVGEDQKKNKNIQLMLRPLPAGTCFSGRLVFHNLKPEELGALLWCLDFGGNTTCRHGLGLGKSFGYGQVQLNVSAEGTAFEANDPCAESPSLDECVQSFTDYMDKALNGQWQATSQVTSLLAMADPGRRYLFKGQLKHMVLARQADPHNPGRKINRNDFTKAKQDGVVLASAYESAAPVRAAVSHVREKTVWNGVVLTYKKGPKEIAALSPSGEMAIMRGADTERFIAGLTEDSRKKLEKGKVKAEITVEHMGGKNWKMTNIEIA